METIKIAIDIDNTITEYPKFFSFMTKMLYVHGCADITILTARENSTESRRKIREELEEYDIYYNRIAITSDKADYIIENGIEVFFEDTDEYFLELPPRVCVFKIREAGNFDFDKKKWVYGNNTGINIDDKTKKEK